MSEGPEVRRTADRLQEALVGRVIESVEFRRKSGGLSPAVETRVLGARVRRVRTFASTSSSISRAASTCTTT
jgi:formamidopyrimidine-DNA glycosylase